MLLRLASALDGQGLGTHRRWQFLLLLLTGYGSSVGSAWARGLLLLRSECGLVRLVGLGLLLVGNLRRRRLLGRGLLV